MASIRGVLEKNELNFSILTVMLLHLVLVYSSLMFVVERII